MSVPSAIQGWSKFESDQIELQLPKTYKGGDLSRDLEIISEEMRKLGPNFEPILKGIEQNPEVFALWVFDSQIGPSGNLTNMNVVSEQLPSEVTLDTYLDSVEQQLPPQWKVLEKEIIQLSRYKAGKVTTEFTLNGTTGKQLAYIIKQGNTAWTVTYSVGKDEFDQKEPIFEESIDTFFIKS